MARRSEHSLVRLGAISLVVLMVVMAAAFNLQRFPGFRGVSYHAQFTDASGLHTGNIVQIAGIRVGRVDALHIDGNHVTVDFDVHGAEIGPRTTASIEVFNLLGEKYLQLDPRGAGQLPAGGTIPVSRTDSAYDIVGTLGELTRTTDSIDTSRLAKALDTLAATIDKANPQVGPTFTGLSRLSRTIASRDQGIQRLLHRADRVTTLLAARRGDLVTLMKQGDLVFRELIRRRDAIHSLLVNTNRLATALDGIARDNRRQIGPVLQDLDTALHFLRKRQRLLQQTIHRLGPYAAILSNIIGTGPWFDAYVPNLGGMFTGEFRPGKG
jgi:phospholipid/cholesterol/gamma-HCH transport system substrate-binding protein